VLKLQFVAIGVPAGSAMSIVITSRNTLCTHKQPPEEIKMNVAKNMEAIVVAAAVLLSASCYAMAPAAPALQVAHSSDVSPAPAKALMQIVVVKAKRLSAAEKARFA